MSTSRNSRCPSKCPVERQAIGNSNSPDSSASTEHKPHLAHYKQDVFCLELPSPSCCCPIEGALRQGYDKLYGDVLHALSCA